MRFIVLVKSNEKIEAGELPDPSLFAAMEKCDWLQPSAKGARVWFSAGEISVTDGPFPNPEELVAGYWVIEAPSLKDAVGWAQRVPFKDGVVEVRQVQDVGDLPPEIQEAMKKNNS